MKIITGQVATKKDFWDRKKELAEIWYKIENGEHILLVAPRRVGKSSIMYNIMENQKENYTAIYIDTESANSEQEFWKKIFDKLQSVDFMDTTSNKLSTFWGHLKNINISKIGMEGVEFGDGRTIDFKDAFVDLLGKIDDGYNLIIMIDEFSQTIENMIKYQDADKAEQLLQTHRSIRQERIENVTFIYAGSIGLEGIASKLNCTKHINDLASIKIKPLEKDSAIEFIKKLSKSNDIEIDDECVEYAVGKISWLIPYYIQLLVDELRKAKTVVTKNSIDGAFIELVSSNIVFEHWYSRLKAFDDKEYLFAKDVLSSISGDLDMERNDILNLAIKYNISHEDSNRCMASLEYDGYICKTDKCYRFNSPLLKSWWYKYVAN